MNITKIMVINILILTTCYQSYTMDETSLIITTQETLNQSLIEAIKKDDEQTVDTLLAVGANPDVYHEKYETITLVSATLRNHPAIVSQLLAAGANPDCQDVVYSTALISASQEGYENIVKILLHAQADPNIQNNAGYTALIVAANRHHKIVELLVNDTRTDLNLRDSTQKTAILEAIAKNNIPTAIYLIKHYAEYTQEDQDRVATDPEFNHIPQAAKDQVFDAWQESHSFYVLK